MRGCHRHHASDLLYPQHKFRSKFWFVGCFSVYINYLNSLRFHLFFFEKMRLEFFFLSSFFFFYCSLNNCTVQWDQCLAKKAMLTWGLPMLVCLYAKLIIHPMHRDDRRFKMTQSHQELFISLFAALPKIIWLNLQIPFINSLQI